MSGFCVLARRLCLPPQRRATRTRRPRPCTMIALGLIPLRRSGPRRGMRRGPTRVCRRLSRHGFFPSPPRHATRPDRRGDLAQGRVRRPRAGTRRCACAAVAAATRRRGPRSPPAGASAVPHLSFASAAGGVRARMLTTSDDVA